MICPQKRAYGRVDPPHDTPGPGIHGLRRSFFQLFSDLRATGYVLEAERKLGEMLRETDRAKPGPDKKDRSHDVTDPPTLSSLGLTKRESAEAQMLASIPREEFEEVNLSVPFG